MKNFAAIDFETANQCHSSVCSVGVVVVRDGKVTDKFYSLISLLLLLLEHTGAWADIGGCG